MKFILSALVVCLGLLTSVFGYHGVDVSSSTSKSSWECLKSDGKSFAIVRVYKSSGAVDTNGPGTISNAWAGGISYVDGYIFPCHSCGNAAGQMDATIDYLASHSIQMAGLGESKNATSGVKVGMLWLDIEGTQYWSSSTSSNVNFLSEMVAQGKARGVSLGIYSSKSQWTPIMGGSTAFSSLPLWYAHYDNNPSYSDWSDFGGWTKPSIKQYMGTTSTCSASVDLNFY